MNVCVAYSLRMTLVFVEYNQFNWIGWPSSQCLRTFVCTRAHTCTCTLYTCMYIVHMHVHVHTLELILTLNTILPYHNTQLLTHFTCIQRSHLLMLSPWHIHTFLSLSLPSLMHIQLTHTQTVCSCWWFMWRRSCSQKRWSRRHHQCQCSQQRSPRCSAGPRRPECIYVERIKARVLTAEPIHQ